MSAGAGTAERAAPEPATLGLRERRRLAETLWYAALWAALAAAAVPWYLRLLPIDLGPPAWTLFGAGAALWLSSALTERLPTRRRLLAAAAAQHLAGVVVLGVVWQMAGGLENPAFLAVFALPVVAAAALPARPLSYLTAGAAVAAVVVLALLERPELRWYLASLGLPGLLETEAWPAPGFAQTPYPALTPPPAAALAILMVFAVLLAAVALGVDALAGRLSRLYLRLETSGAALARAETLARDLIRSSPTPAVLLRSANLQVVEASDSFFRELLVARADVAEKSLLELVAFGYPEIAEAVLRGERRGVPFVVFRVGEETRFARVHGYPIVHGSERLIYAGLRDVGELYFLQAALDAEDEALLVLSVDDRLVYSNRAAEALLGPLEFGQPAVDVLAGSALEPGWWHPGPRARVERRVRAGGTPCRSAVTAVEVPGAEGRLTIVRLRPETAAAAETGG